MRSDAAPRYPDRWFWVGIVLAYAAIVAAALWTPVLGAVLAALVGVGALLATIVGTRRGTLFLGALLIAVDLVLPSTWPCGSASPSGAAGSTSRT